MDRILKRARPGIHGIVLLGLVFAGLGCDSPSVEPAGPAGGPSDVSPTSAGPSVPVKDEASTGETEPKPQSFDARPVLDQIARHLDLQEFDKATAELEKLHGRPDLTDEARKQVQAFRQQIEEQRAEQAARRRSELVEQAVALAEAGDRDAALRTIDDVLKSSPTDEERAKLERLKADIEEHRRRQRELAIAMQLLASDKPTDIRSARSRLVADPAAALPLVAEAIDRGEEPLASNAIGLLHSFNAPEKAVPILLGVLSGKNAKLWPVATRELTQLSVPGAGPKLLKMALETGDAAHRAAILGALSQVVDPPGETLTALLPAIHRDSPELPMVLNAVRHAVTVHGQADLVTLRGLPELSDELEEQLAELAGRLEALTLASPGSETARAALALGIATREMAPRTISDVMVLRATSEAPDSSAKNCFDGHWKSTDVKTMWRHASDRPVSLSLDLGEERTVSGVKLWNHNEAGGRHRGWKEVSVFVSNTPQSLTPVARGVVPMAPGAADPPDYGSVIPVPCVSGRYIRLEATSFWQPDGIAGLSEIQVLGF